VRFSADDTVCEEFLYGIYGHTIANSPTDTTFAATSGGTIAAPTCTGGATAWTTATGWHKLSWAVVNPNGSLVELLRERSHNMLCYTVAGEAAVEELADVVSTIYVDEFVVNTWPFDADPDAAIVADNRVTVTITRGLLCSPQGRAAVPAPLVSWDLRRL